MRRPADERCLRSGAPEAQATPPTMPNAIGQGDQLAARLLPKLCRQAVCECAVGGQPARGIAAERGCTDEQDCGGLRVGLEGECPASKVLSSQSVAVEQGLRSGSNELCHCFSPVPV